MAPLPSTLYTTPFFLALFAILFIGATLRLLAILPNTRTQPSRPRKSAQSTKVLIVLGSGGHTHEMLYLLKDLDPRKYAYRTWVVSSGDAFSAQRAVEFEDALEKKTEAKGGNASRNVGPDFYDIATVPRARKIHQPLYTTPLSSLYCLWSCFAALLSSREHDVPGLIITNGPATAVMVVLASLILKFFDIRGANSRGMCKTIYVESFARVKTLSLSGKLLCRVVDRFLVQWEELEGRGGGRAEYCGILV